MRKPDYEGAKRNAFSILKTKLVRDLDYHNSYHTQDVIESAERIFLEIIKNTIELANEFFPFEPKEKEIFVLPLKRKLLEVKTAAAYHDTGFSKRYEKNESFGAGLAKGSLARYGYKNKQIEDIVDEIMATQLPQNPKTLLEKILCDADLDNFGRDDFFDKGKLIRKELEGQGIEMSDRQWYEGALKLLEDHKYFTDKYFTESAKKLRQDKKEENIKKLKEILEKI